MFTFPLFSLTIVFCSPPPPLNFRIKSSYPTKCRSNPCLLMISSWVIPVRNDLCLLSLYILSLVRIFSSQLPDFDYVWISASAAKLLQSCPTLCDPIDGSPPGSSVPGILLARILEWVAISFSNTCLHAKLLQLCPTLCDPMDRAHQTPLSMGFSRQEEYWSGLPFPSPLNLYFSPDIFTFDLCIYDIE